MSLTQVPSFEDNKLGEASEKGGAIVETEVSSEHAVADGDYPTEEEKLTLPRTAGSIQLGAFLIAFIELVERFSYYGSTVVFTNFLQQPLPAGSSTGAGGADGQSGALGLMQVTATALSNFNTFYVYLTPLLGAWIADTYLGRYKTIAYALAIAIIGHVLLVVSASPALLTRSSPDAALAVFIVGLVITGTGTGAFKSNVSPLVAEQLAQTRMSVKTLPNGQRVIVDPTLTISRVYMYFYLMINIGALVGQIGMVYAEKYVGFYLAYLLPTLLLCVCPAVLYFGKSRYILTPPTGSVLGKSLKLFRHAAKGKWGSPSALRAPSFWSDALPSKIEPSARPGWMTYDDNFVWEVRRALKACAVFAFYPLYWLTYNQINNNLTSQAAVMNTNGLPNDILSNLDPLALVILIPIFDLWLYPLLARKGYRFTPVKKITLGFASGAAAMLWAAVVQAYIYRYSVCGTSAGECAQEPFVASLNVWSQTGSYVLIAISEILASITGLEYAYTKAPKSMKSLVMSLFLFQTALSSAIGFAFVPLSGDPLLVVNYSVMCGLAAIAAVGFWFSFKHLDKQEDELNELAEGKVNASHTVETVHA